MINIPYPRKFEPFVEQHWRYKVAKGGRGSAKSHSFCQLAVERTAREKIRIGCFRETQNSIKDSVHYLVRKKIYQLKLEKYFHITENSIKSWTGADFIFKGFQDPEALKSLEDVDVAYIEEARTTSKRSLQILRPTIRKPGSEIWVNYNPEDENDPIHQELVVNKPDDCLVIDMNWRDNPWFPNELEKERLHCLKTDPESYQWIWEGECRGFAADVVFKEKCIFDADFETPTDARFYQGLDFGYAEDPLSFHRYFIRDNNLYIDQEVYGRGIELDHIPGALNTIPNIKRWEIGADNSRPDTISYLHNKGFRIVGAEKGEGSVDDGITFLRGFHKIIIHKRCPGAKSDFQNYKWKKDKLTDQILPIPIDKNNHACDDARYALSKYIKRKISSFEVLRNL